MLRRSLLFVLAVSSFCIAHAVSLVAAPVLYLLKTITAFPMFNILSAIKLVTLRVIKQLKPVYRLSFLTHGQSLRHRRCLC